MTLSRSFALKGSSMGWWVEEEVEPDKVTYTCMLMVGSGETAAIEERNDLQ